MTKREAKRVCLKRDNGAVTYERIKGAIKRLRRGAFSECVYNTVLSYMHSRRFVLDYRELFSFFDTASRNYQFTYKELDSVPDHIAYCIYRELGSPDADIVENALNSLRTVDIRNREKLYASAGAAEKYLLDQDGMSFAECDVNTRDMIRKRVIDTADSEGLSEFEAAIKVSFSPEPEKPRALKSLYFVMTALLIVAGVVASRFIIGTGIFVTLLLVFPISQTAKDISDRAFAFLCRKDVLPKLKLSSIPDHAVTLVVITTVLCGGKSDKNRFDDIEKYYLSNRDDNLIFGILADLRDGEESIMPEDEKTVNYAKTRINALNSKYGDRFALFVRRRVYDAGEEKFIGWERKRGAICELVRLIKRFPNGFDTVIADRLKLHKTKYILTLDSDTRLYPGAVFDIVGAALHPGNRAVIKNGRVTSGYGVFQPRMDTALESASSTVFSSMLCGSGGVDVYSAAAFDVYQNVFGEGVFCGKGLINVDVYHELADGFFQEDRVLSHDLLEGELMRCAQLTDVVLCDSLPSDPVSFFKRQHRWARGDVQALLFTRSRHKGENGDYINSPFSPLSRYKLFDNVRRLLVPCFSVSAIAFSVMYDGIRGTGVVALAVSCIIFRLISALPHAIKNLPLRFFSHVLPLAGHTAVNCLYDLSSLFQSALVNADALIRSVYRLSVSKKKLLEWTVQETFDASRKNSLAYYFFKMFFGLFAGVLLFIFSPDVSHKTIGLFWVAMPFLSYFLSAEQRAPSELSEKKKKKLLDHVRRHWSFLCDYVTEEDNYLPPDNVQYAPFEKIAHRTSPTNIGLYILSSVAARDLGLIPTERMHDLLNRTLITIDKMPKWRGNLYNWYDTRTLEVIGGDFVSSVDSGNFIACLISAKEGVYDHLAEDARLADIAKRMEHIIASADLGAFMDNDRKLLSVGADVRRGELLKNCYDIYMTECRTASYIAVARGQADRSHWAELSRLLVSREGYMGMLSWNGTMFEYFMPVLFLDIFPNSLEYESLLFAAKLQSEVRYMGVWGKSECGFPVIDGDGNYRYKAVGVPWIGIERGLGEMRVIAPYASFLASAVIPNKAVSNLERIRKLGGWGKYGFCESLDFSRPGRPEVTKSYMSHHVGMSIAAAQNALMDGMIRKRFMRDPLMGAYSDLLKEKIPLDPRMARTGRIFTQQSVSGRFGLGKTRFY